MIIRILVIFLITLTPIKATPCNENPNCDCSSKGSNEININCTVNNSTGFFVSINSRNNLKIVCRNWEGWKNFYIWSKNCDKVIESLSFEKCGLSNKISLKEVIKQLGAKDTNMLIFQSFKNLFSTLKREHLQGFQYLKTLVLSNNGLTNIPRDLFLNYPKLDHIDLSNNNLDLPVEIFDTTPNLRELNLASSGIETIHDRTFKNLKNLKVLNISSNRLYEIKPGTFDKLVSLTNLNLAKTGLVSLPFSIFYMLKKLEILDISLNKFSSIPPTLFDKNKELGKLYLQNNIEKLNTLPDNLLANFTKLYQVYLNNNGFKYLPENLFWGSTSLEYIYLDDNSLDTLPKNIFRGLKNVTLLSIKNNKFETIPNKIFEDMENLKALDLSNNLIARLSSYHFYGLVSLEELNMERNQLKSIDRNALITLLNLRIAKFSHNPLRLTYIDNKLSVFNKNRFLKELHLSNCSINYFFDDWSNGSSELKFLNLSHNFIKNLSTSLFLSPSIDIIIDLRYNQIRNINLDQIEDMASQSTDQRNMFIYFEHNPLICDCNIYNLLRYREREMSNKVYKYFTIISENLTCVQPNGTNEIEISNLKYRTYECFENVYHKTEVLCQNGCNCRIRPSDHTRILDCSYKNMSELLIDENKVIFQEDDNALILNLTGNFLTEIPSTGFLHSITITDYLLSNNKISKITIDKLPHNLEVLELHNNNISRIDSEVVDYLKSAYLKKLTLSGNPIICDCDNQQLIAFLKSNEIYYNDLENIKCKDTNIPLNEIEVEKLCLFRSYYLSFFLIASIVLIAVLLIKYYKRPTIKTFSIRRRLKPKYSSPQKKTN